MKSNARTQAHAARICIENPDANHSHVELFVWWMLDGLARDVE